MSRATKRKHVLFEMFLDDYSPPSGEQQIVRICASRGNNLHEAVAADGSTFLVSMPTKFRKLVWIKRGDYVIVEPIKEGRKVKAEIAKVLTPVHIKYFKKDGVWPKEFCEKEDDKSRRLSDEEDVFSGNGESDSEKVSDEDEEESEDEEDEDEGEERRSLR